MKKEKIILSIIAAGVGLLVAGVIFYLYQGTKTIPPTKIKKISILQPTPTPKPSIFISINSPQSEAVLDKKIVTVSGKTAANAKIAAIGPIDQESGIASSQGDFSMTLNLDSDQNIINVTAIAPNGETATTVITVTYSTESF